MTTLLLHNATVFTMDPARPRASAVLVRAGRVARVGGDELPSSTQGEETHRVDCQGGALLPGFHDAHLHLLGLASRLLAVDCSGCRTIAELSATLRAASVQLTPGRWLRAWGYHEALMSERRHPTRWDLDAAAPERPVILVHRSGHAHVLSSPSLSRIGISDATPNPPEGVIVRDEHGVPTGLLLEMGAWLDQRVPRLGDAELRDGLWKADRLLLSRGVTTVHDATPANDLARWELLQRLYSEGVLTVRCVFMPGTDHAASFAQAGIGYGSEEKRLRVGPAKAMLTMTTGSLHPPKETLRESARQAAGMGFPVAIHAVEAEAVAVAAEVIAAVRRHNPTLRHRIEHTSECPPQVLEIVKRSGAVVVTNPGFIYHSGDRYLAEVPKAMQPWLYRIGAMHRVGIPVAFGSDAPVELPDPLIQVYAAATRRSHSGRVVGKDEAVDVETALRMHTSAGSYAAHTERESGMIAPGTRADLVLLDRDPLTVPPDELRTARALKAWVAGTLVHDTSPA